MHHSPAAILNTLAGVFWFAFLLLLELDPKSQPFNLKNNLQKMCEFVKTSVNMTMCEKIICLCA